MSRFLVRVIDVQVHNADSFVILDVRDVDEQENYDRVRTQPYPAKRPPVVRRNEQGRAQQLEVLISGSVTLHPGGTMWLNFDEPAGQGS